MKKTIITLVLAGALCLGIAPSLTAKAAGWDPVWYAEQNPDVVAEVGNSAEALRAHYENCGRLEGRAASATDTDAEFYKSLRGLFNAQAYAELAPDVAKTIGNDPEALFRHYLTFGILERRRPSYYVTYEDAVSLRDSIQSSLQQAGLDATPGSAAFSALITGSGLSASSNLTLGSTSAVLMEQVQQATKKQVEATIQAAEDRKEEAERKAEEEREAAEAAAAEEESAAAEEESESTESTESSTLKVCEHYDPATYEEIGSVFYKFNDNDCTKGGVIMWFCFKCEETIGSENLEPYEIGTVEPYASHLHDSSAMGGCYRGTENWQQQFGGAYCTVDICEYDSYLYEGDSALAHSTSPCKICKGTLYKYHSSHPEYDKDNDNICDLCGGKMK